MPCRTSARSHARPWSITLTSIQTGGEDIVATPPEGVMTGRVCFHENEIDEYIRNRISAAAKAFLGVGLVYLISCVVEYLIYVPMLGAGGSYLAFITGNLINMKIPCAVNARDIVGAKSGTPENEIISTLSIATSSLVTILVLAVGVVLLIPLQPFLQSPVLRPAFDNVVPALFGAMACKYYRGNLKIAVVPLLLMTVLFTLVPSLTGSTSFMIIPSGAVAIGLAYLFFRKEQKS